MKRLRLTLIDFVVGMAILMILAAIVVPQFYPPANHARPQASDRPAAVSVAP